MTRRQAFIALVASMLFLALEQPRSFSQEPSRGQRVRAKVGGLVCQF